jgi:hypothetical protein
MGDLIRLPMLTPRVREDGRRREEELRSARLSGLPLRRMASWVGTTTTFMRCGSSRRLSWERNDRHLIAATNALLVDRPPREVPLSLDDGRALRLAIALRNLHPGGGAPTPTYVDHTARRLRTVQRAIRDDPRAPEIDEAIGRGNSHGGTDGQRRVGVGS